MKKIGMVIFDDFTDLDFFLPWDLLNRVKALGFDLEWNVEILGDKSHHFSSAGLKIETTKPYSFAIECDALFFTSGPGVQELLNNQFFLNNFEFNMNPKYIAAIDSGTLILAKLGLLAHKCATTYPTHKDKLKNYAVTYLEQSFVEESNIATGAKCLAGTQLSHWMITKLKNVETANQVLETVKA